MLDEWLAARRVVCVAHRGGAKLRPENTVSAFDHAIESKVDGIELDVRLSRDGQPVVIHDATLDRTTNLRGPVEALTVAELSHVDAAHRFDPDRGFPYRGRGIGIARLADVVDRYRGVPLVVEIKGESRELAERTVAVIHDAGAAGRVVIGGFNPVTMGAARAAGPDLITSAATPEVRWALYRSWVGLAPRRPPYRLFQVPERKDWHRVVSRRFVSAARRSLVPVHVWTVNDPADMRRLIRWGVTGLITDRPDVALELVLTESRTG